MKSLSSILILLVFLFTGSKMAFASGVPTSGAGGGAKAKAKASEAMAMAKASEAMVTKIVSVKVFLGEVHRVPIRGKSIGLLEETTTVGKLKKLLEDFTQKEASDMRICVLGSIQDDSSFLEDLGVFCGEKVTVLFVKSTNGGGDS